jgi:WD40 repeat protein
VLGASGTGKSSLVKAGLIPYLKKLQSQSNQQEWLILAPMRPGESPFRELNNTLSQGKIPVVDLSKINYEQTIKSLSAMMNAWCKRNPQSKLLFVVDQLEEVITLCRDEAERENFLNFLAVAVAKYSEQLRIVLTLRSDFEPQFQDTRLQEYWKNARFIVPAMKREELRAAIEEPASARVMYFEPHNLVDKLIDEVAQMPGALPLLSFTLSELYLKYLRSYREGSRDNRAITEQDYQELGGVARSLTQRADCEYEQLVKRDKAYTQTIRHVMLRMVAVGGGELARRRVPLSELEYPPGENERVQEVIHHFTNARLLVKGEDIDGNPYVEPAHDALVRGWQKLLVWKQEDEESLILQRRLTPAAMEWERVKNQDKEQPKAIPDKIDPVLDWLDIRLFSIENLFQKIPAQLARLLRRSQNQRGQSRQKPTQFLWDSNPYLVLLDRELHADNNWLNQVEREFIQKSVLQKRRNSSWRWRIATVVFLGLSGLTIFALNRQIIAEKQAIRALIETSAANFTANRNSFDALINVLTASKRLQQLPWGSTDQELQDYLLTTLVQSVKWVREQNRLQCHQDTVQSVSFSPDGKMLATASHDNTVKLWRWDGSLFKTLKGHTKAVMSVSFSPDSKMIASGSRDGTVRLWDSNGNLIRPIKAHDRVMSVSFSPDGRQIATAGVDKTSNTVKLWRLDGKLLDTLTEHQKLVRQVIFNPKGDQIITASDDQTVKLWSRDGKTRPKNLNQDSKNPNQDSGTVVSVDFTSDGQFFVTGSTDGTVQLWSREGKLKRTLQHPGTGDVWSVSISGDGQIIASGSVDGTIRLWTQDGSLLDTWVGHKGQITSVTFSPDGEILATAGNDGIVKLWQIKRNWLTDLVGHEKNVLDAKFSPDDKMIASASSDGTVRIWSREGKLLFAPLTNHKKKVNTVSFSPKGNIIASGGDDGTIKLWDINGKFQRMLGTHESRVISVSFSNDGKMLASASADETAKLWSLDGNKKIPLKRHKGRVLSVAFSPDGKTIATAGDDGSVKLWSSSGQLLHEWPAHTSVIWSVSFSPKDGQTIITASNDKTIKLWRRDGTLITPPLSGHTTPVFHATFSYDQKIIASASSDQTIKLWRRDGKLITTLNGHTSMVHNVSFTHDNKWLASAGADKVVLLWDVSDINVQELRKKGYSHIHNYWQTQSKGANKLCH